MNYELRIKYIEELGVYTVDLIQSEKLLKTFTGDLNDCMDEVKMFINKQIKTIWNYQPN